MHIVGIVMLSLCKSMPLHIPPLVAVALRAKATLFFSSRVLLGERHLSLSRPVLCP